MKHPNFEEPQKTESFWDLWDLESFIEKSQGIMKLFLLVPSILLFIYYVIIPQLSRD